jgi:transcriptional regulator with XRE-family HTH domain
MTHFQNIFIRNLRFLRTKAELSQLKFSELIEITPNYLNAVENGKYFPSPEVIDRICKVLEILPYQLFLEEQTFSNSEKTQTIQLISKLKQSVSSEFEKILSKISQDS